MKKFLFAVYAVIATVIVYVIVRFWLHRSKRRIMQDANGYVGTKDVENHVMRSAESYAKEVAKVYDEMVQMEGQKVTQEFLKRFGVAR